MGLQNQLSDVSSESILVLMAMLVGKSVSYLHSLVLTILHHLGLSSPRPPLDALNDVLGSGLASLIVLCDQLIINRDCSYTNRPDHPDTDCVVCLNRLAQGDHVRRLACSHVFHKECFDGWLQHLNFNCPLCRAPLPSDQHAQRRVAGDLLDWFPPLSDEDIARDSEI